MYYETTGLTQITEQRSIKRYSNKSFGHNYFSDFMEYDLYLKKP